MSDFSGYQVYSFHPGTESTNLGSAILVEETPIAISIGGISYAVMMVTPIHLEEFVIGFALSEGIIEELSDIRDMQIETSKARLDIDSIAINLEVSPRRLNHFKQKQKAHMGATGCGLCGIDSLTQALPELPKLAPSKPIQTEKLTALRQQLTEHQQLGRLTGAIHAALLLSPDNKPICCMEDIGRHNALDKIIGFAKKNAINLHNHNVLMSSRCSTELIQKAVRVGLSQLTHLASPSTLAVKLATHYGLTLIHLPKQDAPRIYAPCTQSEDTVNE